MHRTAPYCAVVAVVVAEGSAGVAVTSGARSSVLGTGRVEECGAMSAAGDVGGGARSGTVGLHAAPVAMSQTTPRSAETFGQHLVNLDGEGA